MSDWSPSAYLRFEAERTRPARDLLAQVGELPPGAVIDMGCGPGNSTELLVARFADREVIGLDSSATMLAEARTRLPGVRFEAADAGSWAPGPEVALVFANAIYQWVPDHIAALSRALAALQPGGVLAVQMPDNLAQPSHRLMREVAADPRWEEQLRDAARLPLAPVRAFYEALAPLSCEVDIWHSIYNHVLADPEAIVEWVSSTGLRPFLAPLDAASRQAFLADYTARIAAAYPPASDGKVLLAFPRLFLVARR